MCHGITRVICAFQRKGFPEGGLCETPMNDCESVSGWSRPNGVLYWGDHSMRFACLLVSALVLVAGCKSSAPSAPAKQEPAKAAVREAPAPNDPITAAMNRDRVLPPVATATRTAATLRLPGRIIPVVGPTKAAPRPVAVSPKRATPAKATVKKSKSAAKVAAAKKKKAAAKALAKKKGAKAKAKTKAKAARPRAATVRRPVSRPAGLREATVVAASPARAMPETGRGPRYL